MTADLHFYEPSRGHGLRHDPFNSIVGPRPIGWISTLSADGVRNLAPYSFFNAFNYTPPIVGFSSIGWKDTVRNIEATAEFVCNLATKPLAEAMNQSCAMVPPAVDEFTLAGLTSTPGRVVKAPRVLESPVALECRLIQIVRLRSAAGQEVDSWLTLGEVVGVHIDQSLLRDGIYLTAAAEPILRGGGAGDYFEVRPEARFEMLRPK